MLPLAEMVSDRNVKTLASVIESKIPTAGTQELKMYIFAYRAIRWQTKTLMLNPNFRKQAVN